MVLGLGILYAAILIGIGFQVRQVRRVVVRGRRVRGRDVFTGGLFGSVVVFLLGFGLVISVGAALLAYGITGGIAVRDQRTAT